MAVGYKDFSTGAILTETDIDDNLANGPFIHLTRTTDQSITNNSSTDVSWTVETSDRSALVAVTLTSITVPASMAGVLLMSAYARYATNATNIRILQIQVDSVTVAEHRSDATTLAGQPHAMGVSCQKLVTAGQVLKVVTFQNSGGSLNLESGAGAAPQWMINRIST